MLGDKVDDILAAVSDEEAEPIEDILAAATNNEEYKSEAPIIEDILATQVFSA